MTPQVGSRRATLRHAMVRCGTIQCLMIRTVSEEQASNLEHVNSAAMASFGPFSQLRNCVVVTMKEASANKEAAEVAGRV